MSSCLVCGSRVNIDGDVAVCMQCGAEYDIVVHGRKGHFSKTAEVQVTANKIPTEAKLYLWNQAGTTRMEGQTVFVGTSIIVRVGIFIPSTGSWLRGKAINVYRKIGAGPFENMSSPVIPPPPAPGTYDIGYTFLKSGVHTFYAEFPGDDQYAGCEGTVDGLSIEARDYNASPEVSVEAAPALSVKAVDMIFKKPIVGAKVVVDATEAVTDKAGLAVFETLAPATYTLTVSARDFIRQTRKVELTEAGKIEEFHMLHLGAIVAGVVGAGSVGLVVMSKLKGK